jgi:hemolysin III
MTKFFREPLNGFTHFLGVIFSIIAFFLLQNRENLPVTSVHNITFAVYSIAMFALFTASTLYHWLPLKGNKLVVFRKIDHIMIFVFIAASYTPLCAIILKGFWGYLLVSIVWSVAIGGFFMKLFWLNAPRYLYTAIYLIMGWVIIFALVPLINAFNLSGLIWFALGGIFYTLGAVIYAIKKPNFFKGVLGFHEIFHIFILLGAISHFIMNYLEV